MATIVQVAPPSVDVFTVNPVRAEPPSVAGTLHTSVTDPAPAVATAFNGALGVPVTVAESEVEYTDEPTAVNVATWTA